MAGDPHNLFVDQLRIHFVLAAAAAEPDAWEIFTLERESHVVAALVTFSDRGVRRFYTVYYDHGWSRYSPGTALLYEATRLSLAEGLDCDYMTGEQSHKMRLATSRVPLYRVELSSGKSRSGDAARRLGHSTFRNLFASSKCGKTFSSAWNSGGCTHLRLPRNFTGYFRWSIS